jgi:hypothetical protein
VNWLISDGITGTFLPRDRHPSGTSHTGFSVTIRTMAASGQAIVCIRAEKRVLSLSVTTTAPGLFRFSGGCRRGGHNRLSTQWSLVIMNSEQRRNLIEEKLNALGMTINSWAKDHELDHRIVEDLVQGNLRGTHGVSLTARTKMEEYFGPIFD